MARCPKCQHNLSMEELQASQCSDCGHEWMGNLPTSEGFPGGEAGETREAAGDGSSHPQPHAASGGVVQGLGLSSDSVPETWNVDDNAATFDAGNLSPEERQRIETELSSEDRRRMEKMWGGAFDPATPPGMTVKSLEADEAEESSNEPTVEAPPPEFARGDDFDGDVAVDDSSKTFAAEDLAQAEELEAGSVEATFISDEFPPARSEDEFEKPPTGSPSAEASASQDNPWADSEVGDTYLSDELPPVSASDLVDSVDASSSDPNAQKTPEESWNVSGIDQTMISDDFHSDEQDAAQDSAKTQALSDEASLDQSSLTKDISGQAKPEATGDDPADSTDRTLLSNNFSGEQGTGSAGSADASQKTDPMDSGSISAFDAAEHSGLVIQRRSLRERGTDGSEAADYELLHLLGEGGMGKVFNARQTSIDRAVAVKMLKPRASGKRRDQHQKFLAEAVVTGELDHPNIVPIYDVGRTEDDALFYSMKNVTGNPWLDTIHQKSTEENLVILLSVSDAVAFAHARGVVHRDLKPENVMLGEFGEVLVMDWGLAMPTDKFRKQRGVVRSTSMGGTPAYMAPEMATGPITKIGAHSDIYLLGAMLYEIVTGRPPHRGQNAMKCLLAAARNKIVQSDQTGELIEIAYKAMSTPPEDRHKSVQEFQTAVRTYLAHSESITLAAAAENDLERAQKTDSYEDYAKSRFGFEEALKLWDGNKRARTRLGAARLAYAHCAMDKGDYDLASSLLDSGDRAHDNLKVDIVKAKDEREARKKRLETQRTVGRALIAALFVVVSGAAFWINTERSVAVDEREKAVVAEKEAVVAKEEAVAAKEVEAGLRKAAEVAVEAQRLATLEEQKAKVEAIAARNTAEEQRKIAKGQEILAGLNALVAEEQALIAKQNEELAKQAQILAETRRKEAELAAEQERLAKLAEAEQRKAAVEARDVAEEQRQIAKGQATLASLNALVAEEQALIAKQNEELAKQAQILAETRRKEAELAAEQERLAKLAEAEQRKAAVEARDVAEEQRQIAKGQEILASLNAIEAEFQEQLAQQARILAETRRKEAELATEQERLAKVAEQEQRLLAVKARNAAIAAKENEEREAYVSKVGLAAAKIEENAFTSAEELLEDTNPKFRNWEWGYLMHLCDQSSKEFLSEQPLESVALIGDGELFVVGGDEGLAEIRNQNAPEQPGEKLPLRAELKVRSVAVSPDGRFVALATDDFNDGFIKLWDRQAKAFVDVTFGAKSAYADSETQGDEKLKTTHMDAVTSVEFSHDGRFLLSASMDHTARVWDVATGRQLIRLFGHNDLVWDAAFCPNYEKDGQGQLIRDSRGQLKPLPETQIVTVSEDGTALVWQDPSGLWTDDQEAEVTALPVFRGHVGPVYTAAFSADGSYVATGGYDRRVLLWRPQDVPRITTQMRLSNDPLPQTRYRELLGHSAAITSVQFGRPASNNSRDLVLLTSANDHTIKVWTADKQNAMDQVKPVKTFRGHGGWVRDCVFNAGGTWILSVSHDKTAKRWSLDDDAKSEVHLVDGTPLDAHRDHVDAVAFSFTANGKKVATASRDRTAQTYELNTRNQAWDLKPERTFTEGHTNFIPMGVFFADGKKLATAGIDNTARTWDVISGTEQLKLTETGSAGAIAVSPGDALWILTGSDNADPENKPWNAKLWNARSGQLLKTFGEHSGEVTAVAFSNKPDAQGNYSLATADESGRCFLWTWSPADQTVTESGRFIAIENRKAHNDRIIAVKFLPNDERLLTASFDNSVSQWNLADRQEISRLRLQHPGSVSSMDVTPDGKWLVTTCFDRVVRLWSVERAVAIQEFRPQGRTSTLLTNVQAKLKSRQPSNDTLDRAWKLFNPNADSAEFKKRGGWDQAVDSLLFQIPRAEGDSNEATRALAGKFATLFNDTSANDLLLASTSAAAISPNGRFVAATNRFDRLAHVWQLPADLNPAGGNGNVEVREILVDDDLPVRSAVFSPVQSRSDLAILGFSDARMWKLDTVGDSLVKPAPSMSFIPQDEVASANFSPNGKFLVTGGRDNVARVWSVETGLSLVKLHGGHTAPINTAIFSLDGQFILTASDDQTAMLWKLIPVDQGTNPAYPSESFRAEIVRTFKGHTAEVTDAAFSPDGQWVLTASRDRTARLWNAETAREVARTPDQGDAVLCVAFAGDGQRILTGSANSEAQAVIWAIESAGGQPQLKLQLKLNGHSAPITDVAFSPLEDLNGNGQQDPGEAYGLRALTASTDSTAIVWETRVTGDPTAKQVLTLKRHSRPVTAVSFSPDGKFILTGSEDDRAILWPTNDWMADKLSALEKDPEQPRTEGEKVSLSPKPEAN